MTDTMTREELDAAESLASRVALNLCKKGQVHEAVAHLRSFVLGTTADVEQLLADEAYGLMLELEYVGDDGNDMRSGTILYAHKTRDEDDTGDASTEDGEDVSDEPDDDGDHPELDANVDSDADDD